MAVGTHGGGRGGVGATAAAMLAAVQQARNHAAPPPPLARQGEWVCPECASGRAPKPRRAATARERFLQRQGIALARIEAIWQVRAEQKGGDLVCVRVTRIAAIWQVRAGDRLLSVGAGTADRTKPD